MISLQRRIAAVTNLVGQLRELERLRDRVWKAQLTPEDRGGETAEKEGAFRMRGRLSWPLAAAAPGCPH
jgi:hypothetical protein